MRKSLFFVAPLLLCAAVAFAQGEKTHSGKAPQDPALVHLPPEPQLSNEFVQTPSKEDNPGQPGLLPPLPAPEQVFLSDGKFFSSRMAAEISRSIARMEAERVGELARKERELETYAAAFISRLERQRCVICPNHQTPPPDPTTPGDFCTGQRLEYAYIPNSYFSGVAEAFDYCMNAGTYTYGCARPCAAGENSNPQPGDACTFFGNFTITHYWSGAFQGECIIMCSRCS